MGMTGYKSKMVLMLMFKLISSKGGKCNNLRYKAGERPNKCNKGVDVLNNVIA